MPPWTGRWAGEPDELADYLAQAALVVSDDAKRLWRRGLLREGGKPRIMDLGIAAYLLNPEENDYGWPRLAVRWGAGLPRRDSAAALALDMARLLENRLLRDGLLALYENLEIPLAPVLARMEAAGIAIDGRAFGRFLADVQKELDELTGAVYAAAGRTFNIRSAQQLGEVLYGEMGLPAPRKTRGGQASTSQETLERLAGRHPRGGEHPAFPQAGEDALHLSRSAATAGGRQRTAAHDLQPEGHGHRASVVQQSQPAKHPGARPAGQTHAYLLRGRRRAAAGLGGTTLRWSCACWPTCRRTRPCWTPSATARTSMPARRR